MLFKDDPIDIVNAKTCLYQFRDIEPRNKLVLSPGLMAQGSIVLTASETYDAPLPIEYDTTKYLAFVCISNFPVLITVTRSPSTSSNYLYCFGTDSDNEGIHLGHLNFQETNVTGIQFRNVVSANSAAISWYMFQMPPLTSVDSWKDGVQTLGVIP
jgi:hypothetical protein